MKTKHALANLPGRLTTAWATRPLPLLLLLAVPAVVEAQFTYTTNNGTIAITGYTGPGGSVVIPRTINGLPVTGVTGYYSMLNGWLGAFYMCSGLTSVTIPSSVNNLGMYTFAACSNLTTVYFEGNAPVFDFHGVFSYWVGNQYQVQDPATFYCLPGTLGWGGWGAPWPMTLWNPQVQTSNASFGLRSNQFGFNITSSNNLVVVVETCTTMVNPTWTPIATNTLSNGSSYFGDPQWTNYPYRFYRLSMP